MKTEENKVAEAAPVEQAVAAPAAPAKKKFVVTYGEDKRTVEARDANEARALANDARKSWPSPRHVKVEEVK